MLGKHRQSTILQDLCMVATSPKVGDTPVQRPPRHCTGTRHIQRERVHSKTVEMSRTVVIDNCCFPVSSTWLSTGWALLGSLAEFERDYLIPAPSTNFFGCKRQELRYDAACALQNRVLQVLTTGGRLFNNAVTSFSTPLREDLPPECNCSPGIPEVTGMHALQSYASPTCKRR